MVSHSHTPRRLRPGEGPATIKKRHSPKQPRRGKARLCELKTERKKILAALYRKRNASSNAKD